jgi:LmbE family N-acetylglucosaminyl deacetylase
MRRLLGSALLLCAGLSGTGAVSAQEAQVPQADAKPADPKPPEAALSDGQPNEAKPASLEPAFRSQLQPQPHSRANPPYEPLQVGRRERLLVIAPHPDDETLGAGGVAQRVLAQGGTVSSVIVTAGDGYVEAVQLRTHKAQPQPWEFLRYGERRMREAESAAHLLGGGRIRLDVLGFPDGGLLPLLAAHWPHVNPGRSLTTQREAPPYPGLKDRGESYSGHDLRELLVGYLQKVRPTLVLFTDPLDQHPDHRAVGLFALLSVSDYMRKREPPWPRMFAFVIHYDQWPFDADGRTTSRSQRDARFGYPKDFPVRHQTRSCLTLSDAELKTKDAALGEYRTQQRVMAPFLDGFVRRNECFSLNSELDASFAGREIGVSELAPEPAPEPEPPKRGRKRGRRASAVDATTARQD